MIQQNCDLCWQNDNVKTPATGTFQMLVSGKYRNLDLCTKHASERQSLVDWEVAFAEIGWLDAAKAGGPVTKAVAKSSRPGSTTAPPRDNSPSITPTGRERGLHCRYPGCTDQRLFTSQGRSSHESRMHGSIYDANKKGKK